MNILEDFIDDMPYQERLNATFQQDGAPAHTANATLNFLEEKFPGRVVSKGLWPPRSPDLTPCDFFFWGALKSHIHFHKPATIDQLKDVVSEFLTSITETTLNLVFQNLDKRFHLCHEKGGGLIENFLK